MTDTLKIVHIQIYSVCRMSFNTVIGKNENPFNTHDSDKTFSFGAENMGTSSMENWNNKVNHKNISSKGLLK